MDTVTRQHIEELFLEVSRAASRKKLYNLRALQNGLVQLAKLFRAIGLSEEAQAKRLLIQLRGQTGTNEQNCTTAFTEEIPALINNYEKSTAAAQQANEKAMASVFSQSAKVQRKHLSLQKKLATNNNLDTVYHICGFCGFIMAGKAPEKCPICTAPANRFIEEQ